jgi:hypothetical protein
LSNEPPSFFDASPPGAKCDLTFVMDYIHSRLHFHQVNFEP